MNSIRQIVFGIDAERAERNARALTEKAFPEGGSVWCSKCGIEKDLSVDETVSFLLKGIECCGQGMNL